jgi:predicted ArsR family transcriptional regulator
VQAVRQSILEILKEKGDATVSELADALEMAPVSVRYHLDVLQGDNLIEVNRVRRKGSVGRPQQVYALTKESAEHFPNNFASLTTSLLRQLKENLPPDGVQASLRAVAREIAGEFPQKSWDSLSQEERLEHIVDFLTERGYLARLEKETGQTAGNGRHPSRRVDSYLLRTYNCPYAGVSGEHRELCAMDQVLINELVGQSCHRVSSMAEHDHCCTFRIEVKLDESDK